MAIPIHVTPLFCLSELAIPITLTFWLGDLAIPITLIIFWLGELSIFTTLIFWFGELVFGCRKCLSLLNTYSTYVKQALELRQLEMGTHAATPAILLIFLVSELPIPETLMFCLPKLLSL